MSAEDVGAVMCAVSDAGIVLEVQDKTCCEEIARRVVERGMPVTTSTVHDAAEDALVSCMAAIAAITEQAKRYERIADATDRSLHDKLNLD